MPEENELGQEKTEPGTPRRRSKAREKGTVCRSKEVNSAVLLLFAMCILALYGPYFFRQIVELVRYFFIHYPEIELTADSFQFFVTDRGWFVLRLLAPILAVLTVVGVVVNIAQFGWLFTSQTVFRGLKGFSLNPTKILKKIFSVNNYMELAINLAKLCALGLVAYGTLKKEFVKFPTLISMPIQDSFTYIALMLFMLAIKIIVLLLIIAVIDFIWQRHKHEKSLKMSKEEVKEEYKMVEGDPKIKAQIRSTQMRMMVSAMVKKVPEADVVITNPFHLAVAIKYEPTTMSAPTVIAKGARLIAERIKDAARFAGIPIIENKPLAQTIYKTIDVGQEIPPKLYKAVAEILAYVYKLNKDRARRYATVS